MLVSMASNGVDSDGELSGAIERDLQAFNRRLQDQAQELQKLNTELTDNEQRLRLAIETGRIGLWVWNSTDVANSGDWSPRLKEIFGLPLETQVTHELFLKCVHPDDREKVNRAVMDALAGVNGGHYQEEYRTVDSTTGSVHWVTARAQAFFAPDGKPFRFIGTLMEISDRKQVEEVSFRMNRELEKRITQRTKDLQEANSALQKEIEERARLADQLRQNERRLQVAQELSLTGSFSWFPATGKFVWSVETYRILEYGRTTEPTLELARQRVHPEDVHVFDERAKNAHTEGRNFSFQHRLLMLDGRVKHVKVIVRVIAEGKGRDVYVGALMDVSEQKKVEEALRASEQLAQGQLDTLKEILGAISTERNPNNLLQHVLCAIARQMVGESVSVFSRNEDDSLRLEVVYRNGEMHVPRENVRHAVDDQPLFAECLASGKECLLTEFDRDPIWFRFVNRQNYSGVPRLNEKTLSFVVEFHKQLKEQGVILSLMIPMVTSGRVSGMVGIRYNKKREFLPEEIELSLALAQQAALAMQIMRLSSESRQMAIASERNRMARDIHDTLAQGFTGIIAQLQAAEGANDLNEAASHMERAKNLARSSLVEARRSVQALRPRSLHATTLGTALESTLRTMANYSGLSADFQVEGGEKPISPEWEEALLRIALESLTNTIKHAKAVQFRSKLIFGSDQLRLELSDDGSGFDVAAEREGFGLIGMKERVDQMGGKFSIHSQPGQGTETVIVIPYALNPEAPKL
jgi:PAS domain S-box-containing protein